MIIVSGYLTIKPNNREEFIARSLEAVRLARSLDGCIDFAVSPDPILDNRVNVFEEWTSKELLDEFRQNGPEDDLFSLIEDANITEREI